MRGFYSAYDACPSIITTNGAYGPTSVVVVTNRVSSFTEDAFVMGDGISTHVWASPEQVDAQMPEFFTIPALATVESVVTTADESTVKVADKPPVVTAKKIPVSKKRKHLENNITTAMNTTGTALGR